MDLIFAFIAGLLTLINPCVLPVLPIVLASAMQSGKHGPLAIATGMSLSFVILGMIVATVGHSIGLTEQVLAQSGAVMMIIFGLILVIPKLNQGFASATAGFSSSADNQMNTLTQQSNYKSQFLGGMLLGAVWSPCVGPTLGGAISLASQGENLFWVFLIMLFFAGGVSAVIILLGYGTGEAIRKRQHKMRGLAAKAKPIMGITFILVGVMIFFKFHHIIEAWLLDVLPLWLQDLSVKF